MASFLAAVRVCYEPRWSDCCKLLILAQASIASTARGVRSRIPSHCSAVDQAATRNRAARLVRTRNPPSFCDLGPDAEGVCRGGDEFERGAFSSDRPASRLGPNVRWNLCRLEAPLVAVGCGRSGCKRGSHIHRRNTCHRGIAETSAIAENVATAESAAIATSVAQENVMQKSETAEQDASVRLELFLASSGVGARRKCADYIRAGRVSVDGSVILQPGARIREETQLVRFDDELVRYEAKRYFLVNKPKGYICTHRDPAGRPRAVDLVPLRNKMRLFTVGRLDESSQGLLLVTNDGYLANRLAHPRYEVTRTYRVQVAGVPSSATLLKLKRGLYFPDGKLQVRAARKLKTRGQSSFLELDMREGRNREIRRLLSRVGHKVIKLERIAFGPLRLARLGLGRSRELKADEIDRLKQFVTSSRKSRESSSRKSPSGRQGNASRSQKRRRRTAANASTDGRAANRSRHRARS